MDFTDDVNNIKIAKEMVDALSAARSGLKVGSTASPASSRTFTDLSNEIANRAIGPLNVSISGRIMEKGVTAERIRKVIRETKNFLEAHPTFGKNTHAFREIDKALKAAADSKSFWDWLSEHQSRVAVSAGRSI